MNMSAPTVTIVITTRDRHELATRSLLSALEQTHGPAEVIVVDDGSIPPFVPDVTDRRVIVVRNETACGPSAARNQALKVARGEWITFLDDDDVLDPRMLEVSLEAAGKSELRSPISVLSGAAIAKPDGSVIKTRLPPTLEKGQHYFLEDLEVKGSFQTHATLVAPTDVVREIGGFDEALRGSEHDDFFLRLNEVSSIQGVDRVTYTITAHDGPRLSKAVRERAEGMRRTVEKHQSTFEKHPKRYAAYLASMGITFLRAGEWGEAIRATSRSIRVDPTRPRTYAWWLASLAGPRALDWARRVRRATKPT